MSSVRGERQPRSVRHRIAADARTDRDGHHRRRSGRALGEPGADAGRRGARRCSSAAGSDRPGAGAGTASAWSLRTGACSFPATRTTGATPTASCPATSSCAYLESYATAVDAPVREGVEVSSVGPAPGGGFALADLGRRHRRLHGGPVHRRVPAAPPAGGRGHAPGRPAPDRRRRSTATRGSCRRARCWWSEAASPAARSPRSFTRAGRDVFLACGRAGWAPRRIGGHDVFWWLQAPATSTTGWTSCRTQPPGWRPTSRRRGRAAATTCITGRCSAMGVTLLGHFLGAEGRQGRFAADLAASVALGDQRNAKLMDGFRKPPPELGLPELEHPGAGADRRRDARAGGPERARRGGLRGGLPPRLQAHGCTARAPSTSSASRSTRTAPARWSRALLRGRPLPAQAQVVAPHRRGRGRRNRCRSDR